MLRSASDERKVNEGAAVMSANGDGNGNHRVWLRGPV